MSRNSLSFLQSRFRLNSMMSISTRTVNMTLYRHKKVNRNGNASCTSEICITYSKTRIHQLVTTNYLHYNRSDKGLLSPHCAIRRQRKHREDTMVMVSESTHRLLESSCSSGCLKEILYHQTSLPLSQSLQTLVTTTLVHNVF